MDAEPNENGPVLTLLVRLAVLALGVEVTIGELTVFACPRGEN